MFRKKLRKDAQDFAAYIPKAKKESNLFRGWQRLGLQGRAPSLCCAPLQSRDWLHHSFLHVKLWQMLNQGGKRVLRCEACWQSPPRKTSFKQLWPARFSLPVSAALSSDVG